MYCHIEGHIDLWDGKRISGWVYSRVDPDAIMMVDICVNGECIETIPAENYRDDLFIAKKGSGEHAFESSDLTDYLKGDSSLEAIQVCLSDTDINIQKPLFLRNSKKIEFICTYPWTTLRVKADGEVYICICPAWLKHGRGVVGNRNHQSLDEIWKAPPIQNIRKDFSEGNYNICKMDICAFAKGQYQQKVPRRSVIYAMTHLQNISDNGIEELIHDIDRGCNLTCVMCRKEKEKIDSISGRRAVNDIKTITRKGDLKELFVSGAGEAILHGDFVRLLRSQLLSNIGVHIKLNTNLTMITPAFWDSIKHNDISIYASLDGATKQTYEKIRLGARWETVYNNLLFLIDAYKKGEMRYLSINFVVMGCNRQDIGSIIEFTDDLGVDLCFIKHMGFSSIEENIFECCRLDILDEIYEEIRKHNGFELPHVDLGSASLLADQYYRSFQYRIQCAEMQITVYNRKDIAKRIINECMDEIQSGILEVDKNLLSQYEGFIEEIRNKA